MTNDDFSELKNIKVPPSRKSAREQALQAALLAYDEAQEKNNATQPQGLPETRRPMSIFTLNPWSWIMENRTLVGACAATLIALPIAGQLMLSTNLTQPTSELLDKITAPKMLEEKSDLDGNIIVKKGKSQEIRKSGEAEVVSQDTKPFAPPAPAPVVAQKPVMRAPLGGLLNTQPAMRAMPKRVHVRNRRVRVPGRIIGMDLRSASPALRDMTQANERERFVKFATNSVQSVDDKPVSTFSIDVDTASYAFSRKSLESGQMPNAQAVRVEEMINYFSYDYPAAETAGQPFKPTVAIYPTPWNANTKLMHIGIKGHEVIPVTKPRSNLVFLIDISGSMNQRDKLPLLRSAFKLLIGQLDENDTVSIVTYAGNAGTVLEPTKVSAKHKIIAALDRLHAGGSTAGAQGIAQAYALAEQSFDKNGVNRVILATDGDFNVGMRNNDQLKSYIEKKRKSGIFLSVLGFGRGNYNDALMQTLAQNGNGTASYIDTLKEAHKVLVKEAGSTLFPIAKDVKIQVEFNPKAVSEYRLIGYETRALKRADFNNDKIDAGDIGSGHTVTAIYEFTPADSAHKMIDDLRYSQNKKKPSAGKSFSGEYAFLKMRYKLPKESKSKLITVPITTDMEFANIAIASKDIQFAASVAAFGQKLRGNSQLEDFAYDNIVKLASGGRGSDPYGYRSEFITLVRLAKGLDVQSKPVNKKQ